MVTLGQSIYGPKFCEIAGLFQRETLKQHAIADEVPNQTVITHLRTEVQIRERWRSILSGELKFGKFSAEDDKRLFEVVQQSKIKLLLDPDKSRTDTLYIKWG